MSGGESNQVALAASLVGAGVQSAELASEGSTVPLATLARGQRCRIAFVARDSVFADRLQELGFVPGSVVEVRQKAPLQEPVEYEVRGSRFCLRNSEAKGIFVERL